MTILENFKSLSKTAEYVGKVAINSGYWFGIRTRLEDKTIFFVSPITNQYNQYEVVGYILVQMNWVWSDKENKMVQHSTKSELCTPWQYERYLKFMEKL